MLKYTGHPLYDIGAATILAYSKKEHLSDLTEADLDRMADFISEHYVVNPFKSFLSVVFPNSGFTQPAFEKEPERRQEYVRRVARSYRNGTPLLEERCVFTGEQAAAVAFSDKEGYPLGRAFRQHIPMLLGEDQINFFAGGVSGLPVSGKALLCFQAFPLGCAKCGGRLLAVHSDNAEITEFFAARFLKKNQRDISIIQQEGGSKLPEADATAKTLLVKTLLQADEQRYQAQEIFQPASLTAYHFSNSGQSNPLDMKNPPLQIYHLPLSITAFLWAIQNPEYKVEWEAVSERAWQLSLLTKQGEAAEGKKTRAHRNFLYEDMFRLPENARLFIRRYFLRIPIRNTFEDDPRRGYSFKNETRLVSWKLTSLFLERVMTMNQNRIQNIREIADQLASYVCEENDLKFFTAFYAEQRRYDVIRNALIRVNHARLKRGQAPIFKFDTYLEVFEEADENGRSDWRLARDLVLIRMIERLYEMKWLEKNLNVIPEPDEDKESQ